MNAKTNNFSSSSDAVAAARPFRVLIIDNDEADRELILKYVAAKGVRPRLKNRPQAAPCIPATQGFQRFRDCCWMMREVIDDGDAIHFRFHFQPPFHTVKAGEGVSDDLCGDSVICSHCCRHYAGGITLATVGRQSTPQ